MKQKYEKTVKDISMGTYAYYYSSCCSIPAVLTQEAIPEEGRLLKKMCGMMCTPFS